MALGSSKAVGKVLAQRFVVPSVVRQVGRKRPAKMMACLEGTSVDTFERKELFRCVLELSAALGEEAVDYTLDALFQTAERLCECVGRGSGCCCWWWCVCVECVWCLVFGS